MEIKPDFSARITFGDKEELVNRVYDHVHIFEALGHTIIKLVTNEGFKQWHTPMHNGLKVAEAAGITPLYREEISQIEYEQYLRFQEQTIDDDWLDGDAEHPLG